MVSHVFLLAASFSNTVDTTEGNGNNSKHLFFFFLLTAEINTRLTGKIGGNLPVAEELMNNREKTIYGSVALSPKNWGEAEFLRVTALDEFFIYTIRKPHSKNIIIWATSLNDINDAMHYRQVVTYLECLSLSLLHSKMVNEIGQSWNGEYFRNTVLTGGVFHFSEALSKK